MLPAMRKELAVFTREPTGMMREPTGMMLPTENAEAPVACIYDVVFIFNIDVNIQAYGYDIHSYVYILTIDIYIHIYVRVYMSAFEHACVYVYHIVYSLHSSTSDARKSFMQSCSCRFQAPAEHCTCTELLFRAPSHTILRMPSLPVQGA
jgi:hypothetical protein